MIFQKHLSLAVTLRCNLKCELCSAASPYYNSPTIYSAEILNRSIDEYFKIVQHVQKFTLTGGEPLLSPALPHVVRHLRSYLPRIGELEIITNGTLVPNDDLLNAIKETEDVVFLIDNYGDDISLKVKKTKEVLELNGIKHSERVYYGTDSHFGGWVDFRQLALRDANPMETFGKCAYPQKMGFCFTIVGGKIFPCSATRRCIEQGKLSMNEAEILDIFDGCLSCSEKENWFAEIEKADCLKACSYCPGLSVDAERFQAAKQIDNPIKSDYIW